MLEIPERSFVLLDTNVLIDTAKFPEDFDVLYKELSSLHIESVIEETIKLEFLRGLKDPATGQKLIDALCGEKAMTLIPNKEIFERALAISKIYLRSTNKVASVPDTLIAAQLCKYAREKKGQYEMFLATQNHRDFPPVLFERVDQVLITLADGSIRVIGFYRFKRDVYDKLSD
jgi:predicted nucleic acid-binding protein